MGYPALMSAEGRQEEKFRESMFSAINAAFDTGIATTSAGTAYDVAAPDMTFYNGSVNQWAILDQLYLRCTTTNTAGTSMSVQFTKRQGDSRVSGGTALTPVNMGGNAANLIADQRPTALTVYFGVIVGDAAAATFDRIIWRTQLRDTILLADDTIHMTFGDGNTSGFAAITTDSTIASAVLRMPAMFIGPGETLQVHFMSPSQSADPEFEVSASWIERPAP